MRVHVRIQVNYSTASGQGLRVLPSTKCLLYRRCLSNDHRSYELLDISTISHKPGFHETHVNGSIRVFTLIGVTMKLERVSSSHSAECLRDDREIWIPSGFGVSACNLCPSTLLWNVRFIAFGNLEICLRSEKTSKLIKISSYVVERTFWTEIFFFWLRFERVEILRGGKQLILLGCTASEILLTNFSRNKFSFFRKNLLSV